MAAKKGVKAAPAVKVPKGYRQIEPRGIQKWGEGEVVEGQFLRLRESKGGKYGPGFLLDIRTGNGPETYNVPGRLQALLMDLQPNTEIRIECMGKVERAWEFNVFARDGASDNEEE